MFGDEAAGLFEVEPMASADNRRVGGGLESRRCLRARCEVAGRGVEHALQQFVASSLSLPSAGADIAEHALAGNRHHVASAFAWHFRPARRAARSPWLSSATCNCSDFSLTQGAAKERLGLLVDRLVDFDDAARNCSAAAGAA